MIKPLLSAILVSCFLILATGTAVLAQLPRYVISFTDKKNTPYQLGAPEQYLSPAAIQRRQRQQINIDSTDLPVTPAYVDSILRAGNVTVLYTSRWFNQVIIQTNDASALQKINGFPFVKTTMPAAQRLAPGPAIAPGKLSETVDSGNIPLLRSTAADYYGNAFDQIHLHEGEYLHNKGKRGAGMIIAILDAGFSGVGDNKAFAQLRNQQQLIATHNFTDNTTEVFDFGTHGAFCLSALTAYLPGQMVGTAPEAEYVLFRTEENGMEQPIEEHNWIAAAEMADSIGVDVISSSLGYNLFDNPDYNHTYSQLDGKTTIIAQAAALAVRKGMIVVNAAGNEGNHPWKYLLTPADADSVLTVAAVDKALQVATFSGYGPTADGRIKPDVAGLGVGTVLVNTDGTLTSGNGTSYATPVLAGLVTCLWQAFPHRTNMDILRAVKACSSQYRQPDYRIGYGIPNFRAAYDTLLKMELQDTAYIRQTLDNHPVKAFPNPFNDQLRIYYKASANLQIMLELMDAAGRIVRKRSLPAVDMNYGYFNWQDGLSSLPAGVYYLRVIQGTVKSTLKLVKL
ncbi:S8 family serine peptidase [Chitinophaga defluvii]|uniref:S8 family serine peptidase n=1 Tax=Chitinophaga defluvii TaxID=3163343 RepID=A0ABV2TE73_9BACT